MSAAKRRSQGGMHRRFVLPLALFLALAPLLSHARANEDLDALLLEWEMISRRLDERGYEEQQVLLDRIASLRTEPARARLWALARQAKTARQERLAVAALLRFADAAWLDRVLSEAEKDPDGSLCNALPTALAGIRAPTTRTHLWKKALPRAVPKVKVRIAEGLGELGDRGAVPSLLLLLRRQDVDLGVAALVAVGRIGDDRAVGPVMVYLQNEDWRIREAAARALGGLPGERAARALARGLDDPQPRVVESAALSLGARRSPEAVPALVAALERVAETDLRVADAVAKALQAITGKAFGVVPEGWRDWWETVKDSDWQTHAARPEPHTVPARRYYGFPIRSSKLVFVLDVSRSMGWNGRLDFAKKELARVLREMPPTTRFNIVTYSDNAKAWQSDLREATPAMVRRAIAFVQRQRPDNGTNTWAALQVALGNDEADTIFLLSDGHPSVGVITDPDLILEEMGGKNRHRHVHVHCVALVKGDPPAGFAGREDRRRAAAFMKRLAEENGGDFQLVE